MTTVGLHCIAVFWIFTWPAALVPTLFAWIAAWATTPILFYTVAGVTVLVLPVVVLAVSKFYDLRKYDVTINSRYCDIGRKREGTSRPISRPIK